VMKMKATLAVVVVAVLLAATGSANAQSGPGYYGGPPPPPPPGVYRSGLVFGGHLGVGAISFTDCDDCESLGGFAWGLQVGGMLAPSLALLADLSGVTHFGDDETALTSMTFAGVLRGWVSRIFYLDGGLGVGWMQLSDPYGVIADTQAGFGLLVGAGVEVLQTPSFALDIRLRFSVARFDYGDGVGIGNTTLGVGLTWY
jgi:hypothetical protein